MHLLRIDDSRNSAVRIFFPMNDDKCELWDTLNSGLDNQYKSSCQGILIKLNTISEKGLQFYNSNILHEASKKEKIYEISHGKLRLFYFVEKNNMVCTHIHIKKSQDASRSEVNKSVSIRNKIHDAINEKQLKIHKEKENGTLQISTDSY